MNALSSCPLIANFSERCRTLAQEVKIYHRCPDQSLPGHKYVLIPDTYPGVALTPLRVFHTVHAIIMFVQMKLKLRSNIPKRVQLCPDVAR